MPFSQMQLGGEGEEGIAAVFGTGRPCELRLSDLLGNSRPHQRVAAALKADRFRMKTSHRPRALISGLQPRTAPVLHPYCTRSIELVFQRPSAVEHFTSNFKIHIFIHFLLLIMNYEFRLHYPLLVK